MLDLSSHKRGCKYQHRYVGKTNFVFDVSASVQVTHGLKANRTTMPYSAPAMHKNRFHRVFIDSPHSNFNTNIQIDDICTAAELILGVSCQGSKLSAGKLLMFFCTMILTSPGFQDYLYSLEACQKVLEDKIPKTVSCMNTKKMMSSSAISGMEDLIYYTCGTLEKPIGLR